MSLPNSTLAQLNIGRLLAPLESDQLSGFVAALEPINALADAAPGLIWQPFPAPDRLPMPRA